MGSEVAAADEGDLTMVAVFARTQIVVNNETGVFVLQKATNKLQEIGFDYEWHLESGPKWMVAFTPEPVESLDDLPVFAKTTGLAA